MQVHNKSFGKIVKNMKEVVQIAVEALDVATDFNMLIIER